VGAPFGWALALHLEGEGGEPAISKQRIKRKQILKHFPSKGKLK